MKYAEIEKSPMDRFVESFNAAYEAERPGFRAPIVGMPPMKVGDTPEGLGATLGRARAIEDRS